MKRDFSQVIKNHEGRPFVQSHFQWDAAGLPVMTDKGTQAFSHHTPITLRDTALEALGGRWRGEENISNAEIAERMKLYEKLLHSSQIDITTKEAQILIECMKKQGASILFIGTMQSMIENDQAQASSGDPPTQAS